MFMCDERGSIVSAEFFINVFYVMEKISFMIFQILIFFF